MKKRSPKAATFERVARELVKKRDGGCKYWHGMDNFATYDQLDPCEGQLEVAHLIPRNGHRSVKYDPLNLVLLCHKHHMRLDGHPLEKDNWISKWLGVEKRAILMAKDVLYRGKDADKREELKELHRQLKALK